MTKPVEVLIAGVTFDAFKGWAKSKQRRYLDDHPDSTFFDKLGITDRNKRTIKKDEQRHNKLVKTLNKDLKYDPSKKKEVDKAVKESKKRLDKTKKENARLSFSDRKKLLKNNAAQVKEAKKLRGRAKRQLLLTYNGRKRDLIKSYIDKVNNVLKKLEDKRQRIIDAA